MVRMNRKVEPYLAFSSRLFKKKQTRAKPHEHEYGSNGKFSFPETPLAAADLCAFM